MSNDASEVLRRLQAGFAEKMKAYDEQSARINKIVETHEERMKKLPRLTKEHEDRFNRAWHRLSPQYKAAEESPASRNSRPWLVLGGLAWWEAEVLLPYLPDATARRGRPKGRAGSLTSQLLPVLIKQIEAGEPARSAARALLIDRGVVAGLKAKVDHLVKLAKSRIK
jgi:hypothetical protein